MEHVAWWCPCQPHTHVNSSADGWLVGWVGAGVCVPARAQFNLHQIPLTEVGIWTLGEYGQHLAAPCEQDGSTFDPVSEAEVVAMLSKCIRIYFATDIMKGMALTALTKLVPKFPAQRPRIEKMIGNFRRSLRTELQQRSIEYVQRWPIVGLPAAHSTVCSWTTCVD